MRGFIRRQRFGGGRSDCEQHGERDDHGRHLAGALANGTRPVVIARGGSRPGQKRESTPATSQAVDNSAMHILTETLVILATLNVLAGSAPAGEPPAGESPPTQRILVILADDLGVEQLALYRPDAVGLVSTPAIDEIASRGITFRNAWVNPLCSPTRATIQTGKYACRTGMGDVVETQCPDYSLPLGGELPTQLPGFQTSAFGKWHLEDQTLPDPLAPWAHGYDYFQGHSWAIPFVCGPTPNRPCDPTKLLEGSNYNSWVKTTIDAGALSTIAVTEYLPSETVNDAINWMQNNWFQSFYSYLAPQSPFELQHCPPANLQSSVTCVVCGPTCPPGVITNSACFRASLEAFDTKIDQLLRALEVIDPQAKPWWRTTTIFFVGDNGTGLTDTGFWPVGEGKGSVFNGGVHVPFIVAGKAVPKEQQGQLTEAIANGVDVYATVLDMAGQPLPGGIDGVSLMPVLNDPSQSVRGYVYSEVFGPNGPGPYSTHSRAIADSTYTYKLREETTPGEAVVAAEATEVPVSDFPVSFDQGAVTDYFYQLAPDPSEPNGPKKETLLCSGAACISLPSAQFKIYVQLKNDLAGVCP